MIDRYVQIGIWQNNKRGVAPQLQQDLLDTIGTLGKYRSSCPGRTRQAHHPYRWMLAQQRTQLSPQAGQDLDHPWRNTRLFKHWRHRQCDQRRALSRLPYPGASSRKRSGNLFGSLRQREIPWRDPSRDSQRSMLHKILAIGLRMWCNRSTQPAGLFSKPLKKTGRIVDFA